MKTVKNGVIRIIVEMSGGLVTNVYSSAAAQVSVLDWDEEECCNSDEELEEIKAIHAELEKEMVQLALVY